MYQEIGKKLHQDFDEKEEKMKGMGGEVPDFARAIKRLRSDAGHSLEKLASLAGLKKQTLHSIENYSIINPSFSNLEKIATALNVSLIDLMQLARGECKGNFFKTTASQRWTLAFEFEKGFTIHSYSPPSASRRDFFVGVMSLRGGKKLKNWKFIDHSKVCIQPWDGDLLFVYHGMNWHKEEKVSANETLYFDASIPHSFENLTDQTNRVLIVTYPSLF